MPKPFPAVALGTHALLVCFAAHAQSVGVDLNDEIDPHHNNGYLTVSDEKKITMSNYTNYGVMTVSSGGKLNCEKEFHNQAQYDEINGTYLATFVLDGGTFSAYSLGSSHGDFHNLATVSVLNGGHYENTCTFYNEKDTLVAYSGLKPRTTVDNATFHNAAGASYKNLLDGDTYLQNSAVFWNEGSVLNDDFSYFKIDAAAALTNSGTFENRNVFRIVNALFANSGTLTNAGGAITVTGSGRIRNDAGGSVAVVGGKIEMSDVATYFNAGDTVFSNGAAFLVRSQSSGADSNGQLTFSNSGTCTFRGASALTISDGNHINLGSMSFTDSSTFAFSGRMYTNAGSATFSDGAALAVTAGNFSSSGILKIDADASMEVAGGYFGNYAFFTNAGTLTVSSGMFENETQNMRNDGAILVSGTGLFRNEKSGFCRNTGTFKMTGGTVENSATFETAADTPVVMEGGVFDNLATGTFHGALALTDGVFVQRPGAVFTNAGTTTVAAQLDFCADRETLVSGIDNAAGTIVYENGATIRVVLNPEFMDDSVSELRLVLVYGNGEMQDAENRLASAVSLVWQNSADAGDAFRWDTESADGNLAVVLHGLIPEPASGAAVLGLCALAFAAHRRKNA